MVKPILFYGSKGKYGYFSNFAAYPIAIEGKTYSCNEQYIMYKKAELFKDRDSMTAIMRATNPVEIKRLGRQVRDFEQTAWDAKVKEIADTCNLVKFTQHAALRNLLLETGQAILAEASPTDTIWGIGVDAETGQDRTKWRGTNLLGESLMRVRTVLQS